MLLLNRIGCRMIAVKNSRYTVVRSSLCRYPTFRQFASTSTSYNDVKNTHQRDKLHIGFASLSNTLPFDPPDNNTESKQQLVGDTELDTQATIMLTALRGGVTKFDTPSPPTIESNKVLPPSNANSITCWNANRQSEVQLAKSLDQAWNALLEEDDNEANHVLNDNDDTVVTIASRLGYRSAVVLSDEEVHDAMDNADINDCQEREGKFTGDARVGMLFAGKETTTTQDNEDTSDEEEAQSAVVLVHNLSKEYVLHSLRTSPLVQQYKLNTESSSDASKKKFELISLAHNPETQMAAYLLSNHQLNDGSTLASQAHAYMKQCMTSAFVGHESAVKEGLIDGYGVDSNGLSLPESHDMYFDWRDVLECAVDAYLEVHGDDVKGRSSLRVIRLPGNILETRGLSVANETSSFFGGDGESNSPSEEGLPSFTDDESDPKVIQKQKLRKLRNLLPKNLDVNVTRPLTAYPFGGTGFSPSSTPGLAENGESTLSSTPPLFLNGEKNDDSNSSSTTDGKYIDATHPIRLLDCQIERDDGSLIWTNDHYTLYGLRPAAYQPILNAALSRFDADEILEASRERELTVEEKETLDACKLLRDLIHDLDASLDTMKSFAAYEEYLVKVAVPLMYGSFEELDEESSTLLQLFFKVHGMAVRMVVARWTRDLVLAGHKNVDSAALDDKKEDDNARDVGQEKAIEVIWKRFGFDFNGGYNIPDDVTLQEFALKSLLKDKRGVVVGCSRPEHVLEAFKSADTSGDEKN